MSTTNNTLPPPLKTNFKNKVLNPIEEPYLRKNNPRKHNKTNRDLYELSASQERTQQEIKSSIELKISSKSILPTLREGKSAVYKRYREKQNEVTLDKLLGSDFKQIELSQIEDFSKELFPPRPVSNLPKIRHDSLNSLDNEKENIRIENHLQYSYNYETNFLDNEPESGSYSDDLHYKRLQTKPGKLYLNASKLMKGSPLEGNSPQNQGLCQSSTLPASNQNEYKGYNSDFKSPVLREIHVQPHKKSQFSRKVEEIEANSPMDSGRNDYRQVTPAVLIMENNENFYDLEKSPERIEKNFDRNNSQKYLGQIETRDHYKSQIKSDKNSPAISYKGIKPLNTKQLKENKTPLEASVNESGLVSEDQILLQKYGSKFGIKPQELYKKRNRSPLQTLQLSANSLSGRNLRNSTPFTDDKKQVQSSTLQQKYKPLFQ